MYEQWYMGGANCGPAVGPFDHSGIVVDQNLRLFGSDLNILLTQISILFPVDINKLAEK